MMARPPFRVLRVVLLAAAVGSFTLGLGALSASAAGKARAGKSGGGHGYSHSGGVSHGGGSHRFGHVGKSRSVRNHYRGRYGRHRSYGYRRYRPFRYGVRRHSYRSYSPYGYGYSRYYNAYPTPIYYYQPRYYGDYYSHYYLPSAYQLSLERKVHRLERELYAERYGAFFWKSWPPYYRPQGPSAEGSCLYGPDATLLYQPEGKDCADSLAAR